MYSENSRPWFFWLLLTILISIIVGVGWWGSYSISELDFVSVLIALLIFLLAIPYMCWITFSVATYFVKTDGLTLIFGYLGWNVRFTNSEIISAKMVDIKWMKWGGMGWRMKSMKSIGYITNSGPGVEIQTMRKGRTYTFNCQDPQALLNDLHRAGITIENDSAV